MIAIITFREKLLPDLLQIIHINPLFITRSYCYHVNHFYIREAQLFHLQVVNISALLV